MKGVSDKNAQNNKKSKGNKNDVKKPLQVLHISKKDSSSVKEEVFDDYQNISNDGRTEIKSIKPQTIKAPINEENENFSENMNLDNESHQEIAEPLI